MCEKYSKLKKSKIWCDWNEILVLSIYYAKCGSKNDKTFQEKESIQILKILGLNANINE